jgi:hypothetical protein
MSLERRWRSYVLTTYDNNMFDIHVGNKCFFLTEKEEKFVCNKMRTHQKGM